MNVAHNSILAIAAETGGAAGRRGVHAWSIQQTTSKKSRKSRSCRARNILCRNHFAPWSEVPAVYGKRPEDRIEYFTN